MTALNRLLDAVPRVEFRFGGRPLPAFRVCGTAGFYAALLVSTGAALIVGRPLAPLVVAIAAAVASFFGWALLRSAITRRESLVLLEHLWLALAASAGVLYALGVPVLPYLDLMAPGLGLFLAGGRAGCLMAGCCHGNPSSTGLRYTDRHAEEGFPFHLVNVRLFPVQALECAGLLGIAALSVPLVLWAREGSALAWLLLAYAVLRFGTEGLRGDERAEVAGVSVPRIMCIAQAAVALRIADPVSPLAVWAAPLLAVAMAVVGWWYFSSPRRLLRRRHISELRRMTDDLKNAPEGPAGAASAITSVGVSVALSRWGQNADAFHVSLRLAGRDDPRLACRLAARAFPDLATEAASYTEERTLHFVLPPEAPREAPDAGRTFRRLYRTLLLEQRARPAEPLRTRPRARPWYFRRAS